ncbi:MAG: transglycosylase SLT domain-containing protein [Leucobacter sp.]
MSFSAVSPRPQSSRWSRVRGVGAAVAVVAFLGTAVAGPFSLSDASADDQAAMAYETRIHQEFTPEIAAASIMDVDISKIEEEPKPEPEPEPKPTVEESSESAPEPAPGPMFYTGGGAPAEWMAAAGIPESEWGYVDSIVQRESGWNPNAVNSSSGASGLVQALPCGKVPGSCFDPVDNLRWADGYAKGRYGSWQGAFSFWEANHWW